LPDWCGLEWSQPLGMGVEAVRQAIDCYALEKQAVGPSGIDHRAVDRIRS